METIDNEFVILLDDYKIHVQHELMGINNKIEEILSKRVKQENLLPKEFTKFKSQVFLQFNSITKRQKMIEKNLLDFNEKLEKLEKIEKSEQSLVIKNKKSVNTMEVVYTIYLFTLLSYIFYAVIW